jgi:hypothetical protein
MSQTYFTQEEDVIGLLPENELMPALSPLSDRILIKVRPHLSPEEVVFN